MLIPPGASTQQLEAAFGLLGWPTAIAVRTRTLVRGASPRVEHTTGRALVKEAAAALGRSVDVLPRGPDRVPVWPPGLTGSITHADGLVVAAVGWAPHAPHAPMGLGIDCERSGRVSRALADTVLTVGERRLLASADTDTTADRWITLAFCVKEACGKAQFSLTGELLEFDDIELLVGPAMATPIPSGTLIPVAGRAGVLAGWEFPVFACPVGEHLVTGAVVRRSAPPENPAVGHRGVQRSAPNV